jgi:transcriptional regulator with XRE-family HTH domain
MLRKRSGHTLRSLEKASRVSVSRLSAFENGQIKLHPEELYKISELLRAGLDAGPRLKTAAAIFRFLDEGVTE